MPSAVAGYKTSLGSDGPPPAYADIELADCFFIIGSNTAEYHPIVFRRIKRRKEQATEDVKVIVVDPRARRLPTSPTSTCPFVLELTSLS
jgi:anaerobic selenocysteine-containing dehydrogenase